MCWEGVLITSEAVRGCLDRTLALGYSSPGTVITAGASYANHWVISKVPFEFNHLSKLQREQGGVRGAGG